MTPADPPANAVRDAVTRVMREMEGELGRFALVLFPGGLRESFGGWLLPAESRASPAVHKSYELHQLIERVEDRLADAAHTTVTIDLTHASYRNGH